MSLKPRTGVLLDPFLVSASLTLLLPRTPSRKDIGQPKSVTAANFINARVKGANVQAYVALESVDGEKIILNWKRRRTDSRFVCDDVW